MAYDPYDVLKAIEVPDIAQIVSRGLSVGQGYQQNQQQHQLGEQQIQQNQNILADEAQKQVRSQAYGTAVNSYLANPTADGLRGLMATFPEEHEALSAVAKQDSEAKQQRNIQASTSVIGLVNAGNYDAALKVLNDRKVALANGGEVNDVTDPLIELVTKAKDGDQDAAKRASGLASIALAGYTGDKAPETIAKLTGKGESYTLTPGSKRFDADNNEVASVPVADKPEYVWDADRGTFFLKPGTGGGDPSSGGASGGDTTRLINSDAGGGYVPTGVKTLGQFVAFGKALNQKGAKSSSAGTYQINGSTMAEFAPKAIGPDWKIQPYTAENQDKVGNAIFDWAKQQPDPASALQKRWVSLSKADASRLVAGSWAQARSTIAQGETGGGPGASAARSSGDGGLPQSVQVADARPKTYSLLSPQENQQLGLNPDVKYQRSPTGEITALGGQNKAQLKPLPPKAADAIATNTSSVSQIDRAIALLEPRNQSRAAQDARYAIGSSNSFIPDAVLQRTNPAGVDFRAQIGQIGGVIIKDISGAAVSASEDERLKKWVPSVTDTPQAALAKLKSLRRNVLQNNESITSTYGEDQGYRPFENGTSYAPKHVSTAAEAAKLKPGTVYVRPDGTVMRR